jgi:regulator of replication initiation timing
LKQGEKQLIVQVEKLKKNNAELLAGKQHLELENKHLELKVKQLLHRLYGKKARPWIPLNCSYS